jgi:gamma-glutamyltranspeptidase/glutathione hydrolase
LLVASDLAGYHGSVEACASVDYRGGRVYKCPPWSQGPVFLQQLRLLERFDLAAMEAATTDALHTLVEVAKLAFADREACYGDPDFSDVPLDRLLSRSYAEERVGLIDPDKASLEQRPGLGAYPAGWPWVEEGEPVPAEPQAFAASKGRGDTTHLDAVDAQGNLVAATPSGAWIMSSPVIPELGFPIGTRAQMFSLDPRHPNRVEAGKRPRTTLTPSLADLPDGRRMAFGTPGGDQQDQWTLQFLLQLIDFAPEGDLQQAIDAPTVHSMHMPSSFYPRTAQPGWLGAESRLPAETIAGLAERGHRVLRSGAWEHGRVMAVTHRPDTGQCEAASSPRSVVAYSIVLP